MSLKRFRSVPIVAGTVLLIWFLLPLVTTGIINIGNVTGILISLALVCAGYFSHELQTFLLSHRKSVLVRILISLLSLILFFVIVLAIVESVFMISACRNVPESESDTVVVLGCQSGSVMMQERTSAAYSYLVKHPDSKCILSGGQGPDEAVSEAKYMYSVLVNRGIDPSRLLIENQSASTRENLEFSLSVIRENGLSENIALVTNEFHEYRAALVAADLGLTAHAVPAQTTWWLFPTFYVRELYGILYEWIF